MDEVGRRMRDCELFVPEVLIVARATRTVTAILRPLLVVDEAVKPVVTVILGTVRGDSHDIRKNVVGMTLESAGLRIIDLEVDVPSENIVDSAKQHNANFNALSVLLTTASVNMTEVVEAAGERASVFTPGHGGCVRLVMTQRQRTSMMLSNPHKSCCVGRGCKTTGRLDGWGLWQMVRLSHRRRLAR